MRGMTFGGDTWRLDEADAAYRKADAQVAGKGVFLF
jgi:hypothetical protein